MGGQWVSDDSFLIYETLDVGPVLLNTNGDITPLIPKLNGDTTSPRNKVYAQAAINNGFHILLTPRDETAQSFGVQLYHSKSGNTEILPAQFYDGYLSPQGQWLLLRTHEGLWLRSTDESQPLPQKISSISDNAVLFSPDEKLMLLADDTQQTTQLISPRNLQRQRSIRLRSDQQTYTPILYASQWSPDGKAVAMLGLNPNQAISALFVYKIGN